jgi:hypothetical protein
MGVPALEVGYISATTGRGHHEVHKGHVVALGKGEKKKKKLLYRRKISVPHPQTPADRRYLRTVRRK